MDKLSFANEVVNCCNAQGSNSMIQVALLFFFSHFWVFFTTFKVLNFSGTVIDIVVKGEREADK